MCAKVLTLKGPPAIYSRHRFFSLSLLKGIKECLIFHLKNLPADDSHEMIKSIFLKMKNKILQNLWSAATVTGALTLKAPITSCSRLQFLQHFS